MTNLATIETMPEPRRGQDVVTTPSHLLAMAVQQGADLDKLEKLMALQERWEATEARKAFTAAVAAFKANPPRVLKDRENKQYGSRYSSLGNMVTTVSEAMGPHGLSANWEINQGQQIEVTCVLTHVRGHSERVTLKGAPDRSGAKNDLQQIKSTLTYLKLATFEAVTGIASEEGNLDDDGNASGEYDATGWFDAIRDAANLGELNKLADELKTAKVPAAPLKAIRREWAARAKALKEPQA